jgi:tetratricopeptide (TPR) repeat protein
VLRPSLLPPRKERTNYSVVPPILGRCLNDYLSKTSRPNRPRVRRSSFVVDCRFFRAEILTLTVKRPHHSQSPPSTPFLQYQQVLDSPLHPHISKCFRLIAIAHFHKDERELAISAAMKYLTVTTSLNGFDSAEALNAHLTLADILIESRKSEALTHIRAAYFLMEFMAGKDYSGISSQYYRMGSHYFDLGNLEGALHCFKVAALKRSEDRMFECHIARNTARILARLGKFKQSFDYEKKAYQLYAIYLGDEHEATKACSATLVVSQNEANLLYTFA